MSLDKPPPPPAAPPNPWAERIPKTGQPLIASSTWPHRLLHVKSMTSYVKENHNIYNKEKEPVYNVLSYTWGRYQDETETPLLIHGITWPVPSIKRDYFSAAAFKKAIELAAKGFRRCCDWVWVDIGCIPQDHAGETAEDANIRAQEIGRQVEIFGRAIESFVWLSSLKTTDLVKNQGRLITLDDLLVYLNHPVRSSEAAECLLSNLHKDTQVFVQSMRMFLQHPWMSSLWTLQEMVLRPESWILFDDGLLSLGFDENGVEKFWSLQRVKHDTVCLRQILTGREPFNNIIVPGFDIKEEYVQNIWECLKDLSALQVYKGLDALSIRFPHTAYSLAQNRSVMKPIDRIYGIVQTYGISCKAKPPGDDDISRLHSLEDDFGIKLVAKAPALSQLFIHSTGPEYPRRSWLITQKCKVGDHFWTSFTSEWENENLFKTLEICEQAGDQKVLCLRFVGHGWELDEITQYPIFQPSKPGSPEKYRGLMLDNHISKSVLGSVVDYFDNENKMRQAVRQLYDCYCHERTGKSNEIRVALLASSCRSDLPVVHYVALVLAPSLMSEKKSSNIRWGKNGMTCGSGLWIKDEPISVVWERIGLMRWTEMYHEPNLKPHYNLPTPQNFECFIY
ncbi:hypothetical protein BP6252_07376 [Coleophoma cylindrospora]|uniref:Heterokaryon incompatibility domain-containing protein n=1 Tax=Coleophoma cylindrospora TaxID=1849047 RepID=A0A3D8RHE1_9HELO|nr:hypothetical protein BP6252_07376 [Coleophoma cylindrospora]